MANASVACTQQVLFFVSSLFQHSYGLSNISFCPFFRCEIQYTRRFVMARRGAFGGVSTTLPFKQTKPYNADCDSTKECWQTGNRLFSPFCERARTNSFSIKWSDPSHFYELHLSLLSCWMKFVPKNFISVFFVIFILFGGGSNKNWNKNGMKWTERIRIDRIIASFRFNLMNLWFL